MDTETTGRLVEEAVKRSSLVWVRVRSEPPAGFAQPMWHVWHDGSAYVLTDGIEQPLPAGVEPGGQVEVIVRSKDKGSRLVSWVADVVAVEAESAEWAAVVPDLQAKRLNLPDGDRAPVRWARESHLWRLAPTGVVIETPDQPSGASQAAPPVATPATTPVPRPWHLFGRSKRRR